MVSPFSQTLYWPPSELRLNEWSISEGLSTLVWSGVSMNLAEHDRGNGPASHFKIEKCELVTKSPLHSEANVPLLRSQWSGYTTTFATPHAVLLTHEFTLA